MQRRISVGKIMMGALFAMLWVGGAQACDYWRDQGGSLRGFCKMEQSTEGRYMLDLDLELMERQPRYRLKMPNLQIRRMRFTVIGGTNFELFADVRNVDAGNAPASVIVAMVDILVAGTTTVQTTNHFRSVNVPALSANSEQRVSFGVFSLPDRKLDWDVAVVAAVDPPTPAGTVGGVVFESNETDNAWNDLCRIYGANPNLVGPRACL